MLGERENRTIGIPVCKLSKVGLLKSWQHDSQAFFEPKHESKTSNTANEFYQKGCQEKSSASTGGEMFSRDPAHGS